eukprot:CAMPEP_0205808478 /NCGR_PEP_ID=MMETSP0205-20121125/12424_1 /ASSEMBLY_ACC=CAM_ASM_000278 /TAXON_ID=36767 /ORGANISM="Euplotes focardii, Strain TN1" /LENGTH=163 /DNA_ID=CAMNT_0053084181 /DNA_START=122 /DNA_END=610 /DNA_ORIENTATION=-
MTDEQIYEELDWEDDAEVMYLLPMLWEAYNLNRLDEEDEELFIRYLRALRAQMRVLDAEDHQEKANPRDLKVLKIEEQAILEIELPPHLLAKMREAAEKLNKSNPLLIEKKEEEKEQVMKKNPLKKRVKGKKKFKILKRGNKKETVEVKKEYMDSEEEQDDYW